MARLSGDEGRRSSQPMAFVRSGCPVLPWDPTSAFLRQNLILGNSMRLYQRLALILCALGCLSLGAFGQTDVNDVHVAPREVEKPADAAKDDVISSTTSTSGMSARVRPMKVDVNMVLVPVTITDPMNRLVTGLEKPNFQLFEGNSPQEMSQCLATTDVHVGAGREALR